MKLKSMIIGFFIMASLAGAAHADGNNFFTPWCQSVGEVLKEALNYSFQTETYEEEKEMLVEAIEMSIERTPEKRNFYFLTTLKEISVGLQNYSTLKDQVLYLRSQTQAALSDLQHFDQTIQCPFCESNNGLYVEKVIRRGLEEGFATKTNAQEIFALNHTASLSLSLLNESSYSRSYTCSKKFLSEALEVKNLDIKRSLIQESLRYLDKRLFCRQ